MLEQNSRIMIVDPDFSARTRLRAALEALGCRVIQEKHTAREAIEGLDSEGPQVVFCDWELQEAGGLALLKLIKAQPRFQSIFFVMTAVLESDHKDKVLRAVATGVDAFLTKPVDGAKLVEFMPSSKT